MNSILDTVKKFLGLDVDYPPFDTDIIVHINSAFLTLNQLGIGPPETYFITSSENEWTEFLGGRTDLEAVKLYVCLKVRMLFDPPTNSFVLEAMNKQCSELEWRLNAIYEREALASEEDS